jgi:predicted transcriptional regulator
VGELERAVMEVLWSSPGPQTVRDVLDGLADDAIAYTTVMTVLDRLAGKGSVRRERDGRAWRYVPAASREEFVAELMRDALERAGDRGAALTHFAQLVSGADAAALRAALDPDGGR